MPELQVLTVTPDMAAQWLEKNSNNRNVRKAWVETLARAISNGEWELTYDPIRFNGDGTLIDGQHRLAAIALAGVPVESAVAFGMNRTTQLVIDSGTKRTVSDALKLRGEPNASTVASALNYLHMYEQNGSPARATATTKEALRLLEANPSLRESVSRTHGVRAFRFPHGMAAALHYIFAAIDPEDADDFFTTLMQGTNLTPRDPIHLLRRRLEDNALAAHKLQRATLWAYTVKAWNAWRNSEEMGVLRWRRSGKNAEKMPRPQ